MGNSTVASTVVEGIEDVNLMYWIKDRSPSVGYRRYFDCVSDVKVTHSPRFMLDVDLVSSESFFAVSADRMRFDLVEFLAGARNPRLEILEEMRRRARERSEVPWWLDPTDEVDVTINVPGLRYRRDLEAHESAALQKTLFLGFPEILAGGGRSFYNAAGWAISRRSVIVTRDWFSAGGRCELDLGAAHGRIDVPGVVRNFLNAVGRPSRISLSELGEIHGRALGSPEDAVGSWVEHVISGGWLRNMVDSRLDRELAHSLARAIATEGFVTR